MHLAQASRVLSRYIAADIPAFLHGAPGIGKSDLVREIADRDFDGNMIDFRAVLRDPVDLRGLPSIDGDTARWLVPDDLPQADRDGERGIFFMDELNAAPASMQAACFGLVLDRRVGTYTLPPGWVIVAAGNRQMDRAAAQRMPTALANRFAHIDVEADVETFVRWALTHDIDPLVIAFLRFRPALLHQMAGQDLRAFPSPRSWAQVSKIAQEPDDLRLDLVAGLVGEGAGAEYEGFMRVYKELPSLDAVIANPRGTPIPNNPAARFALAAGLSRKASAKNLANVLTYLGRMPREFNVMAVVDASRRDPGITHTQAFTDWCVENQDVTFTS